MNQISKHIDVLLAGAIGDAIGYIIEFKKLSEIYKLYGNDGLTLNHLPDNYIFYISDDTQMTLFTLQALLQNNVSEIEYRNSFYDWYNTQNNIDDMNYQLGKFKSLHSKRAPGTTCLLALRDKTPITNSKGCGGIMRTCPTGFLKKFEDSFLHGMIQNSITHGHPTAALSSGFFSGLINLLLQGNDIHYSVDKCIEHLMSFPNNSEVLNAVNLAKQVSIFDPNESLLGLNQIELLGEGWIAEEALSIALYSLYKATSFEQIIQISINHNGDSDSTGSLAAQLWVAAYGLPEKYKNFHKKLDIADAFEYITNEYKSKYKDN